MNANLNFDVLLEQLPEPDLWRLLQDVVASEIELGEDTIRQLDDRMQGFLFTQDYVTNRAARIDFARSPEHMPWLRDAAGSRNVWMTDDEFIELVGEDDSQTLACFARSEQMRPHHLAYIEYKLARHPHGNDFLATSYDASITLKKALECQGHSREMALFRLARAALDGSPEAESILASRLPGAVAHAQDGPRALWRAYLNLASLDEATVRELLEMAGEPQVGASRSIGRPAGASRRGADALH